ncbi:MAG: glycosyltransferase [Nanoarchaeota archaeon]|nr:glycosyltransferase [Nanoarchaeota archaeon]
MKIKKVDIIVGIPSYNEADNISFVVEQASKGLTKYFPSLRKVIVNVDNNSEDGTKDAFLNSKSEVPLKYISTPPGVTGKGNNFRNLFKYMLESNAKSTVVVDADLKSISSEWIQKLGSPIIKGYDYVVPIYTRHKYDGTITNNICYPLLYGLIGKNIRQPIAGDFAFSNRLCKYYLTKKWNNTTYHFGIDNFMTLNAIFGGFKIIQTGLGSKVHKPSAPKLSKMFTEVVYTLFSTILNNKKKWENVKQLDNLGLTGKEHLSKGQSLKVDDILIKRRALLEYQKHHKSIKHFLSTEVFSEVDREFSKSKMNIGPELWAKIVYDLLYRFNSNHNRLEIIKSMKSLYFGRVYSFIQLTKDWSNSKAEEDFRKQAEIFRDLKPYLLQKFKNKKKC